MWPQGLAGVGLCVTHIFKSMSLIISQKGKNAKKIDKARFDKEDYLQQYIHQNPEAIPVYEIAEDKKLFVAAREFSTESGPIDALAVDKDGDIYIVETKLYKNPDKRTVVAQALDYGASLWKHFGDFSEFLSQLDQEVKNKFECTFAEKAKDFFNLTDEQLNIQLDSMQRNLREGNLKFVILMDSMEERLKDLIIYVNQNSQFDIYAVELEYYKFNEYEIMIPKIFGVEVKKNVSSGTSSKRNKWDESKFLDYAKQNLPQEIYSQVFKLFEFSKNNASAINYGTGAYPAFSPIFSQISDKSLFTLTLDNVTRLSINFEWAFRENEALGKKFNDRLVEIGIKMPKDYLQLRPSIDSKQWRDKTDGIIKIIKELIK